MSETKNRNFDVIIIGNGHQGLICANYLARAGLSVTLYDQPAAVPGGGPYDQIYPDFRSGVCAHVPIPVNTKIIEDLQLSQKGWSLDSNPPNSFSPQAEDEGYLFLTGGKDNIVQEISKFSQKDADTFLSLYEKLHRMAQLFDRVAQDMPFYDHKGWRDLWSVFETGKLLSKENDDTQAFFATLMTESLLDYLDQNFDSDAVKGLLCMQATMGSMVNPAHKGSANILIQYILGMDTTGQSDGPLYQGTWHPLHGSIHQYLKSLTQAALDNGVVFQPGVKIDHIITKDGVVQGIADDQGRIIQGRAVVGDINPTVLFLDMMEDGSIPPDFALRLKGIRAGNSYVRMKVAVSDLPKFKALDGQDAAAFLKGDIIIAPSLNYVYRAYDEAEKEGTASLPAMSMVIPTMHEPSLAPSGSHVISLMSQYFDSTLENTQETKAKVAGAMIDVLNYFAPGFEDSILNFVVLMGDDLDRTIGPVHRDALEGGLPLHQVFAARFGYHALANDVPLQHLYLCGYGPESSANSHTNMGGYSTAQYLINKLQKVPTEPNAANG